MKKIFYTISLVFIQTLPSLGQLKPDNSKLILWYNKPAENWNEALPVGNGRLGAMVFGGTVEERIQLNEESLWSGSRFDANPSVNPSQLKQIQQLILNNKISEANDLANETMMGSAALLRSYQPLGDFFIHYTNEEWTTPEVKNYRRELDLKTGIVKTYFERIDQTITQEVFASAIDNMIVVKISTNQPGKLGFKAFLSRKQDVTIMPISANTIQMQGNVVDAPSLNSGPGGIHTAFAAQVKCVNVGGKLQTSNSSFLIEGATSVVFYITAATDYNLAKLNFDKTINPKDTCIKIIEKASLFDYDAVLNRHQNEYSNMFSRVSLNLNGNDLDSIPTNQRLQRIKNGATDLDLQALYFQFGRYLLMSSSRPPSVLPANLQGLWNQDYEAPWDADYHTNINIQMNYWPAQVCNLEETFIPYSNFVNHLREPGSITAQKMYGAKGWVVHHATDVFGRTSIVDAFNVGGFPIASSWLVLQLWDHYQFTNDKIYLKNEAYPAMKEAAEFILDFLIKDKNGLWATVPSNSPENSYILPNGEKYMLTHSATIDIQIINQLFNSLIAAQKVLKTDIDFIEKLKAVQANLPKVKVSEKYKTVQEWIEDYDEADPGHRHISPLFGLYPGTTINPQTPELFAAANRTIERRLSSGGGQTGWSRAWIINFYARLLNGNKSYENLNQLLQHSTLNNLLDNHPPFQIDGNFGATAAIAEMLLQSQNEFINLLPALPTLWKSGEVKGLKARGNYEISIKWENNQLKQVTIKSFDKQSCKIQYASKTNIFKMKKNEVLVLNEMLKNISHKNLRPIPVLENNTAIIN